MICGNCGIEFDSAHDEDLFLDLYYGSRPLTYSDARGSLHLCMDCAVKKAYCMDE